MHFGHSNEHRQYKMRNEYTEVILDTCMEEKELGVWTDDKLEFTEHIRRICVKVARSCQTVICPQRSQGNQEAINSTCHTTFGIWSPRF